MIANLVSSPRGVVAAVAGVIALLAAGIAPTHDIVLHNATPSMPVGFYARVDAEIARGAVVTVRAVDVAESYAATRSFTDPGDRFLKRVAAVGGDRVCAEGSELTINDVLVGRRFSHDSLGQALPAWSGCATLAEDQVILLGDTADSFDGRYWGPVSRHNVEGVWRRIGATRD